MAKSCKRKDGRIAQLDRVPGYEPGGRRFESSCAHHFYTLCLEYKQVKKNESGRIAQLDRVPGYEPGGRRFESSCAHHFLLLLKLIEKKPTKVGFFMPEI